MNAQTVQRRYELDWLRVLTILAIFVFHCTRLFDPDDWTIKNQTTYLFMNIWKDWANSWGMPLIMIISGASAFLALSKVRPGKYVQGLVVRLFVPLMFGMFTHVAFQIYLERLNKGTFTGSFFEFYPHYFDGMYGFGGNFAWMGLHLWYLELLFMLSLLCLPLFAWLKYTTLGQRLLNGLGNILSLPGFAFLFALPAILLIYKLDPATWGNQDLGGWSVLIYPFFFIAGFIIISNHRLQESIQRMRWIALELAILLSVAFVYMEYTFTVNFEYSPFLVSVDQMFGEFIYCMIAWSWLLAIFGFAMKRLTFTNPFLKYASEASLPFYILHQSVIVTVSYFVVQWAIPDWTKFITVIIVSFLIVMGLYEYLVRRFNLLRFLFGMKLNSAMRSVPSPETQLKEAA
jgi:peptidoglycan/LPS O-acetylase OafA/YrhL